MTITNPYYEFTPQFVPATKARSDAVNVQYQLIQNAFDFLPGDSSAITTDTATFAPESGTGNAYVVTMPDTRTSNQDGDAVRFFATHSNTGPATLAVDAIGAVALVNWTGTVLGGGEIVSGRIYEIRYDATNAQFVISASTDGAIQVSYAEEWAIKAEDVPVSVAAGGDGVTDFSAFHWAQKALAGAVSGRVLTDINTATPPTTEGVTGAHEIWDADQTDLLQRLGFQGSNTLVLKNFMHGGGYLVAIEDDTGIERMLLETAITAGGDATWDEVEASADFEGADGATSYTELSLNLAAATFNGGAELDTAQFQSGTSSLFLDRSLDSFVSFPDIAGYDFGTQDWTLEGYARLASLPAIGFTSDPGYCMVSIWDDGAVEQIRLEIIRDAFGTRLSLAGNGFAEVGTISGGVALNTWFHWAITRTGGDINAYWNGTQETSDFGGAPADMGGSAAPLRIGQSDGIGRTDFFDGWIDDVRLTIGTARYTGTGSITPESTPFPTSGPSIRFDIGDGAGNTSAQAVAPSSGGLLANNLSTGAGIERVLTASDLLTNVSPFVILADIVTATPPTTEAVTGMYEIWDNDESDLLAQIGFPSGSNVLQLRSYMQGGNLSLQGEDAGGAVRPYLLGDPDGNTTLSANANAVITVAGSGELAAVFRANDASSIYHDNIERIRTGPAGKMKLRSDGDTDTEELRFVLEHSDGTDRGWLGYNAATTLTLKNEKHSGTLVLSGEDSAGVTRTFFNADPNSITDITAQTSLRLFVNAGVAVEEAINCIADGAVELFHNDVKQFATRTDGVRIFTDINTATPPTVEVVTGLYEIWDADGTDQLAQIGYRGIATDLKITNRIHGGRILLTAEDDTGTERTLVQADPEGVSILRGDTNVQIEVQAGEAGILAFANSRVDIFYNDVKVLGTSAFGEAAVYSRFDTDTELRRLSFLHNDQTSRGYIGFASTDIFRMENEIHGGNLLLSGQDGAGVTRDFFNANPDTNITIAAPETMFLTVNTNDAVKVAIVCASGGDRPVDLYADGSLRLRTQLHTAADNQTGVAITGPDGTLTPAGLAGSKDRNISIAGVNRLQNSWQISTLRVTGATSTLQTENSTGTAQTDIRAGSKWYVWNMSGGTTSIAAGTGVTLTWLDGAGGATGTRTLADRGQCTVQKLSDTSYFIWGIGLT